MGSSYPPELPEEFLRPGSQEFLRMSRESVENLRLDTESLLREPLELTESRREDDTESRLEEDIESRRRDPMEDARESRRRVEPNAAIGRLSFLAEPSLRREEVENAESRLRDAGKDEGCASLSRLPEPSTIESRRKRLAFGSVLSAGIESLLGDMMISLRKLMDSRLLSSAGILSRRGPTPPLRMLSRLGGGGASDPRLPCTSHFRSSVVVLTTDTRRGSGVT